MSLRKITIQYSSVQGKADNTSYPFRREIETVEDLKEVAAFDHAGAEYADGKNNRGRFIKGYRNRRTFQKADCLIMDCDNSVSDPLAPDIPPEQWKTPADVHAAFPDVPFYVVYSRNHMKEKDGKPARPRFHVYFIMDEVHNEKALSVMKGKVQKYFPAFDPAALDAARFLFGVNNPQVEFYDGDLPINLFMDRLNSLPEIIPVGQRNSTLSQYGARVLKKYGDTQQAYTAFCDAADRCEQSLDESELQSIWKSACSFFHNTVEKDPNYISPDEYAVMDFDGDDDRKPVTSHDIKRILARLNITVRLNVLSGMVEITGMPPQYSKGNAANTLPVLLTDYMIERNMKCSRQNLDDYLVLIEDENRFNPIEEMLQSVTWDGQDRLTELTEIAGIAGNETEITYLRKWLHQSVAMALNDDIEPYGADGVLVIQGKQGTGKTLLCSKLAIKAEWFAEGVSIDLTNKDSVIQATSTWIAELGELDSTLKREQSALKAFITVRSDTYRQPYARAQTTKPRRTSYCATVNPTEFLNDETGSRRWWVIHPGKIDCERLIALRPEWMKQLWAQVYKELFLPNPQGFRLTADERAKLDADNEQYSKPLPGEIEIRDKLDWDSHIRYWKWYKVSDVREWLFLRHLTSVQVGKALKKIADSDPRIQMKAPRNIRQYLLPPKCESAGYYPSTEDFKTVLSGSEPLIITDQPQAG